jgi:hypothetical protein
MANVDSRFGLRPVDHLLGINWSSKVRKCYMTGATGAAYIGDPVIIAGSSDATGVYPTVIPATLAATNRFSGVIVGFEPDPDDLSLLYRKNSTNRYALVCTDPYVIYEVQACSAAVLPNTTVGLNAIMVQTHAGDTATGLSGQEMDSGVGTAPAADATYQLCILGLVPRPDNDISAVNAKWRVLIGLHTYLTAGGILGV